MKKIILLLITICTFALCFTGCGKEDMSSEDVSVSTASSEPLLQEKASDPIQLTYYHVFETDNIVYVSEYYMPLFCYDKATGKTTEINDLGYSYIYYNDGYIYGMTISNGGIGNICRYNLETEVEEVLSDELCSGYTIKDEKIYFTIGHNCSEKYMMNLDGTGKDTTDIEMSGDPFNTDSSNSKDYSLSFKETEEMMVGDFYLNAPDGDVYLGRFGF